MIINFISKPRSQDDRITTVNTSHTLILINISRDYSYNGAFQNSMCSTKEWIEPQLPLWTETLSCTKNCYTQGSDLDLYQRFGSSATKCIQSSKKDISISLLEIYQTSLKKPSFFNKIQFVF